MVTHGYQESDFLRAYNLSFNNERIVKSAETCGCFFCLSVFSPDEVEDWVDDTGGRTALCPRCGIDSVICSGHGYPINREFLKEMKRRWFW